MGKEIMLDDDILDSLGVRLPEKGKVVECGGKAPKAKRAYNSAQRFTEWRNLPTVFTFSGYVARITRHRCGSCGGVTESLDGLYTEETSPSGERRLTALDQNAQWPLWQSHRLETEERSSRLCPSCVRSLGFTEPSGETSFPPILESLRTEGLL